MGKEEEEVLANRAEAPANQAEDAIPAEEVVRGLVQKGEVQQQVVVVVDPAKMDDDEADRVDAAEDTDNAHNMHRGDGREREDHPQRH